MLLPPAILYHYTTPGGLRGIVSAAGIELWATDVEFMNDSNELLFARGEVADRLLAHAEELAPLPDPPIPDRGQVQGAAIARATVLRNIENELVRRDLESGHGNTYRVYATCFSDDWNLLGQWRAYTADRGYALGFNTDSLRNASSHPVRTDKVANVSGPLLRKVLYGIDEAEPVLTDMLEGIAPNPMPHPGSRANIKLQAEVLPVVASIKDPAFAEEREWRLISPGWETQRNAEFRDGPYGLTPYIRFVLPQTALAEIVVGPGQYPRERVNGLRQFLRHVGLGAVEVRSANSPLRV